MGTAKFQPQAPAGCLDSPGENFPHQARSSEIELALDSSAYLGLEQECLVMRVVI